MFKPINQEENTKFENHCKFLIKGFFIPFSVKSKEQEPSEEEIVAGINRALTIILKTREWKKYEEDYFGISPTLLKKVNSIKYVGGLRNLNYQEDYEYDADIDIELDCVLVTSL